MNSADLVAKLLATENLTIVRNNCKTAFFDIKARVLSLPLWKDMTPEIEGMLIAHEVGHALYTSDDYISKVEENKNLMGYVNIVEDARIEKLMKRKFPGIRKTFNLGYKELMTRDFFELKDRDLNNMLLIDRINLFFKAGYNCGVKFTPVEKEFVDRVDRAETIQEVIALAQEIYDYSKEEREKRKSELVELPEFDEDDEGELDGWDVDDGDALDDDSETEKLDETLDATTPTGHNIDELMEMDKETESDDKDLQSETERALDKKLQELADDSVQYNYWKLDTSHVIDPIIGYKRVIRETVHADECMNDPTLNGSFYRQDFNKFMLESEKVVNYLVKEFEMRKSAQAYKRTRVAKSGSLNLNKLYASKLSDDIFKRVNIIPNGKNHGMIFLLDWSGSMGNVILPTVKQVINLVMFCRRINIPFEVYAFTGSYLSANMSDVDRSKIQLRKVSMRDRRNENIIYTDNYYSLLQLFSHKMTNSEFMTVARRFTSPYTSYCRGYSLGDTPLNDALVYMNKYIPEFRKKNNVEKLTFVTLTDGQSCRLDTTAPVIARDWALKKTHKNFVRDEVTGKDYEFSEEIYTQTELLLRMIRDRNEVKVLGFYICRNRRRDLGDVFRDHYGSWAGESQIDNMRKEFRDQGFSSLKNTGRDELFIIPDTSTKIDDSNNLDDVSNENTAAQIARKFSKMLNTKKHSRVLLDRFIGYVA